jgi:hypothetical protein
MGKLILYRPSEEPFDAELVRAAFSRIEHSALRPAEVRGAALWLDVLQGGVAVSVRLNETRDAIWIDSDDSLGFGIVSSLLGSLGETLVLADLQGSWARVNPGAQALYLQQALAE